MTQHDFIYELPPRRWLDGIPLGNGRIGAMLWGDGNPLHINLDSYHAWETREVPTDPDQFNFRTLKALLAERNHPEIQRIFCPRKPTGKGTGRIIHPTRLPLPRMDIGGLPYPGGRLRLEDATWDAGGWSAFVHAGQNLLVLRTGGASLSVKVAYSGQTIEDRLALWGYPPLEFDTRGRVNLCIQRLPQGGLLVIAHACRDGLLLATVCTSLETPQPVEQAVALLETAGDITALAASHRAWWRRFWDVSALEVPDARVENLYYAEWYKLGSSARPDGPAITLQGLWTADGVMPPWAGDYHVDLNVQLCYWPVYAANRLDLGQSCYRTFSDMLPVFRKNCREFFGIEGGWSGCALGYGGTRVHGYPATEFSPGNLAWLSHLFWLHYRYSMDKAFLRDRAYPMMKAAWQVYNHLLEPGDDGRLHLPIGHSPEYAEGSIAAWDADSSYDAALIRFLCEALRDAGEILGIADPDRARYEEILARLYDYPGDTELWVSRNTPLDHSHRHHAHLMAVHPLGLLTIEGTDQDRARIENSLWTIRRRGTGEWCGYSFPAMALIAARTGKAEMAWHMLQEYFFFISPNTLHLNGDPRQFGASHFTYDPMTLEGGFCFAAALQEMLLQSWNGVIRLFPAVPPFWQEASFRNFLAEGGVAVSAVRRQGRVVRTELTAPSDRILTVKGAFGNGIQVDGADVLTSGAVLTLAVQANRTVTITAAAEESKAPAPAREGAHWFGLKRTPRF